MGSAYNKAQRKKSLYKAIELRDTVVQRENHKTKQIERMRVSPRYIKYITGIKMYEAFKLGVFKTPEKKENKKNLDKQLAKAAKANQKTLVPRRIKTQ